MQQSRHQVRPKISIFTLFMITLLVSALFCIFYFQLRDVYNNRENLSARCLSELANVKYQLDNVLEYKKTMDKVISDLQEENNLLKQTVKEFSNNYLQMKQNLDVCETQSEDLEVECKAVKLKLENAEAELLTCKKAPG